MDQGLVAKLSAADRAIGESAGVGRIARSSPDLRRTARPSGRPAIRTIDSVYRGDLFELACDLYASKTPRS